MPRPGPAALTLAALAIVAALLFSGGPDSARAARLAALEANLLLSEGAWPDPSAAESGADAELILGPAILAGSHVEPTGEGTATLRLGQVRVELGGGEDSDAELVISLHPPAVPEAADMRYRELLQRELDDLSSRPTTGPDQQGLFGVKASK